MDKESHLFDSDESESLTANELADEIAKEVGIDNFSSDSYDSNARANFNHIHRAKIYAYITGENGYTETRKDINRMIMEALDSKLHAGYDYEFVREDLRIIHHYVKNNPPNPNVNE